MSDDYNDDFDDAKPLNPFAVAERKETSVAVAAAQRREEAEVFAMVAMAHKFKRDEVHAVDLIINDFARPSLAEQAQYQFARGGTDIVGPSIRSAEAIAQRWGNLDTGWEELERSIGVDGKPYSRVRAYCIDLQTTMRKELKFIVPHWRDTKKGGYKLTDERDIYEVCANMAQRRLRACILASIPGDVIETAMKQAEVTLRTNADTSPEAQKKLIHAFEQWGVTKEHIETRIQRRLDAITAAQMVGLKRIYVSLRDDMSAPADWFEGLRDKPAENNGTTSLEQIKAKAAETPAPGPAPADRYVPPTTGEANHPSSGQPAPADPLGLRAGETPLPTITEDLLGAEPPPIAFEDLKAKLANARKLETLEQWYDMRRAFTDAAQLAILDEFYEARKATLEKR